MASVEKKNQAQVEDCSDSDTGPITRKPSPQANVSTKRSRDLNSDKGPILEKVPTNIDGRSDSGYSSYTAASKSSADSAPRTQPPPPPATAHVASQSPASKSQKSAGGESRQHSTESSPRQRPSRTASVSSKSRPAAGQRRMTATQGGAEERSLPDPNWLTCGPNAARELPHRNRRPEMPPSMSSQNIRDHYPSDQLSQHSDPNPYPPPSPTYTREPAPYSAQGPAIVQAARTRRPSAAGTRPRPQSFAGDPSALYGMSGMPVPYPSPPQEQQQHTRGPPPAAFYRNMQHMQNMYPGMPTYGMHPVQQPGYPYAQQQQQQQQQQQHQTSPPYDVRPQRPELSARGSSGYGPRSYPTPIITQEPFEHSARYPRQQPHTPVEPQHHSQKRLSHQMPLPKLLHYGESRYEDEESSDGDSSEEEEEEHIYDEYEAHQEQRRSRALMPPPKLIRAQSQRRPPPPAHAKTAPAVERRESRRKSIVVNDPLPSREHQREPRVLVQRTTTDPSRRASVSRPPNQRKAHSEYVTPQERIEVNNSRSNRRQSYQTYERQQMEYARAQQARAIEERYKEEQKRERRASNVYVQPARRHMPGQFEDDSEESDEEESGAEQYHAPDLRRTRTDTIERPRKKDRAPSIQVDAAELYINSTRGAIESYADTINKAARRGSRMPAHSESGSSHSSGRASQSNRTTMTSNTNGEVRLRLESGQAINLQLSGEMEGRTLQLLPAENGMTDLVIGNARGGESSYHSEKSSMRGSSNPNRRSTISNGRRDAEVISERSTRRPRRDRDEILPRDDDRNPVLRRSRKTNYH